LALLAGLKLDITSPSPVPETFLPSIEVLAGFASTLMLFVVLAYSAVDVELVFTVARDTSTFTWRETPAYHARFLWHTAVHVVGQVVQIWL
jgi:hypothetical protein